VLPRLFDPDGHSERKAMTVPTVRRRGRLRLRYGYVLAAVIVLGLIGGAVAVVQNHGRVPDKDLTATTIRSH